MRKLAFVVVLAVFGLMFGCKEKSLQEKGKEALAKIEVPATPDKVVTESIKAVKEGDLLKVYAMLPDSYQKDVQALVTKVTAKLDKETWDLAFKLLTHTLDVAKKQKDKVAPMAQGMDIAQILGQADEFMKLLTEATLNDFETVKGLDVAGFLAENGKKFSDYGWKIAAVYAKEDAEEAKKMLDGIKVEAGKVEGDKAEVAINGDNTKFVKVEGKWVPEDLAGEWKERMKEANEEVDGMLAGYDKNKARVTETMKKMDEALTKFETSGKVEDIMGAVGPMMGGGRAPAPEAVEPAPAPEGGEPAPAPAQ